MRRVLLALALTLTVVPAFAGNVAVDLPRLTWPQEGQTTTSTKGCVAVSQPTTVVCQ